MNVHGLIEKLDFEIINEGSNIDEEVTSVECCDLLSVAMGNLPSGCAWVTVMSNINTLAVAFSYRRSLRSPGPGYSGYTRIYRKSNGNRYYRAQKPRQYFQNCSPDT